MKKIILFICLIATFNINGQTSKKDFIKNIEWINKNPSEFDNKKFVSKSADLLKYQFFNHPNFSINISGMKELDEKLKGHKYERYFQILYSFNQLAYKVQKIDKFNNLNACTYSMEKLIESYKKIIEKEPRLRTDSLDEYANLDHKGLMRRMKKIL